MSYNLWNNMLFPVKMVPSDYACERHKAIRTAIRLAMTHFTNNTNIASAMTNVPMGTMNAMNVLELYLLDSRGMCYSHGS